MSRLVPVALAAVCVLIWSAIDGSSPGPKIDASAQSAGPAVWVGSATAASQSRGYTLANTPARTAFQRAEIARIRAHLARVERELRSRDVSDLSPDLRAARLRNLGRLHAYTERGIFPRNERVPHRIPIFIDRYGTHCAVGHLIAMSGREDIARRIAATRNYARVPDLADDAELVAWVRQSGLTLDEAARIQPSYNGDPCCVIGPDRDDSRVSDGYAAASMLAAGLGGVSLGLNLSSDADDGGAGWRGLLGLASGGLGMGLGAGHLDDGGTSFWLGFGNLVVGSASAGVGLLELLGAAERGTGRVATPGEGRLEGATDVGRRPSLVLVPGAPVPGGGGPGVVLRLTF